MGERESFRTVPSVKDGIKVNDEQFCSVRMVEYQPGNGTRYALTFVRMEHSPPEVLDRFELMNNHYLVILHNLGNKKPMVFKHGEYVVTDRVKKSWEVSSNDAAVLTELIAHIVRGHSMSIEDLTEVAMTGRLGLR